MASIRSIRKRHQEQMGVTIGVRKVLDFYGPWLEFPDMDSAVAYLDGLSAWRMRSGASPV